ncbi:MAG: MATE family efflux transporter [Clostridia bacterium]|nr:MATE family efflux transporter [Clostridia bacterium]
MKADSVANPFLEESVGKLYAKFLPSAIIALLISTVASLIDTVVVSHFMGPAALSAVNICMPIYSILTAIAMLIVGGASTMYSKYLGQGDKDKAHKIFTLSGVVLLVIGILYMIAGVLFTNPIVHFLGATDNAVMVDILKKEVTIADMATDYARILFLFVLFNIMFPFLQTFLRIDMNPGLTVVAIVACAAVNLVLDILFIGPFLCETGFGTTGAAFATCLAYVVATIIMCTHFFRKKNTLRFVKGFFHWGELKTAIATGFPASVTLFGTAITTTVFNNFIITSCEELTRYGITGVGELYVSVFSVIVQVMTIAMAVYVGIPNCAQPMIAANFAAGKKDRVKQIFETGMKMEIIANIVLTALLCLLAGWIANAFSMSKGAVDMTEVCVFAIRIFSISLVFTGINQMVLYLLQTCNFVKESTIISALSGTVLLIAGLYLLAGVVFPYHVMGLGIWLSYTFAQALTMVYSLLVFKKHKNAIF